VKIVTLESLTQTEMQFVKIQDAKTLEIIQWRVDGVRVNYAKYHSLLAVRLNNIPCHLTNRTKNGNYRHSFSTN
jgi:hypothetical protein